MKQTTIKLTSVSFDTDGDETLAAKLEKENQGSLYTVEHEEDENPLDLLADLVSDISGWCVFSVNGEIVETK